MTATQTAAEHRVFTDCSTFVGFRSGDQIRSMLSRRQLRAVRKKNRQTGKADGQILRYVLCSELSDLARQIIRDPYASLAGVNGQQSVHYTEALDALTGKTTAYLVTIKKPGPNGSFVRWRDDEGFRPDRFNPDHVRAPFFSRN